MTYIAYVPGLSGDKSLERFDPTPQPGTNYHAIKEVADARGIPSYRLTFQTAGNPFPTLSDMGRIVAEELDTLERGYGEPGIVIAGSVGAGVLMQAFTEMTRDTGLPHVIAFKPVFNPLGEIAGVLNRKAGSGGTGLLQKLAAGHITELKVPVEATTADPDPGIFVLQARHVRDEDALRLLEDPTSFPHFVRKLEGRKMPSLILLCARNDAIGSHDRDGNFHFLEAFRQYAANNCRMSFMPGTDADDHTAILKAELTAKLDAVLR